MSVPIESSATMRPSLTVVKAQVAAFVGSLHVANRKRKSGMRRMSDIWPVSYCRRGSVMLALFVC
jgi:hypothetical protein